MTVKCMDELPRAWRNSKIVYHGSSSNFKQLRISKKLSHRLSTEYNEGYGIYFSTDRNIAHSYGNYIYVLEINNLYFHDFRLKSVCLKYLALICQDVKKSTGIDIRMYADLDTLAEYMYLGGTVISAVDREISLILDSEYRWHQDIKPSKMKQVYSVLRRYNKYLKAYMFNYNIKNIGVIRDVSPDVVRIIDKYKQY